LGQDQPKDTRLKPGGCPTVEGSGWEPESCRTPACALGIGAFAEKTLVTAGQCTKVDPEVDADAVGLLGCGVMAGIGAAINTGEVKALTGGNGADVVIDAVGRPETYKQAFYARDLAGRVVLVGVPTPDMTLELPLLDASPHDATAIINQVGDRKVKAILLTHARTTTTSPPARLHRPSAPRST
jgi:Zn-dependent alcohol dehydrogenase